MATGGCCGKGAAKAASVATPRDVTMPDGKVVTVTSAAQERAERDKAYVRIRDEARRKGFRVTR